jgi:hypothetical protein
MVASPRPVTQAPDSDPRPGSRPATVAGGKAHWDALTTEALATGGLTTAQQANGFNRDTDSVSLGTIESLPHSGSIPSNLRVTAKTATTVDTAWEPVASATSYRLRRGGVDVTGATALTVLTFHETGLTTGTGYDYTVSALVNGTRGPESPAVHVVTA